VQGSKTVADYDEPLDVLLTINFLRNQHDQKDFHPLGGAAVVLDRRASVSGESGQSGDHGDGRERGDARDCHLHRAGIPWQLKAR
jgi:hypothetical protein